jgi:hypothetical protein
MSTIRARIVEMATSPSGVCSREVQDALDLYDCEVTAAMQALEGQGRLVRAKAQGHKLRWFSSAEHAVAWQVARQHERVAAAQQAAADKARHQAERAAAGARNRAEKAARAARRQAEETAFAAEKAAAAGRRAPSGMAGSVYTAGASRIAPRIKGEPIVTGETVVTVVPCRAVSARWQMLPGQPLEHSFAALGVGRYLSDVGLTP